MPEKIRIVLQQPGKISIIAYMTGHMNDIVGGLSTEVTIPENGLKLVMNVHSDRRGMPNLKTLWGRIFGTVVIAAKENGKYISLTTEQIQSARVWLLKHTWEEEK